MITLDQLQKMLPNNNNVQDWYEVIEKNLPNYDINTIFRIAAFISQCSHESAGFTRITENLNYKTESLLRTFPSHFQDSDDADEYAHKPEKIANRIYADRMGNGSEDSGDGWRYRGRGVIQLTGKDNYQSLANSIQMNLEDVPAYLETFDGALVSACWFWVKKDLNTLADSEDIESITKKINGGLLGLEERQDKYDEYKEILNT